MLRHPQGDSQNNEHGFPPRILRMDSPEGETPQAERIVQNSQNSTRILLGDHETCFMRFCSQGFAVTTKLAHKAVIARL